MESIKICFLLSGSVLCFLVAVYYVAARCIKSVRARRSGDFYCLKSTGRTWMRFAFFVFFAVFCLRFAVGLFAFFNELPLDNQIILPRYLFVESLIHALQSFSMDEDYSKFLEIGQQMMQSLVPRHAIGFQTFITCYSLMLNFTAPLAGGAILFDILTELFPRFRYRIARWKPWGGKFYFTALNDSSLALAKSIVTTPGYRCSTIVFTDAYTDDENEESTERLLNAKSIGAICLKDDLTHISFSSVFRKPIRIFLSDTKETDNLATLSSILNQKKNKLFRKMEVFVFGSDTNISYIEDEVMYISNRTNARLREEYAAKKKTLENKRLQKPKKESHKKVSERKAERIAKRELRREEKRYPIPRVLPVNGVKNIAQGLFYKLPLFECLPQDAIETNRPLNLTILGSGVIGTELFLAAYWLGQMLHIPLCINIVSKNESEKDFINKIDFLNSDILKNTFVVSRPGQYASPDKAYATLRYYNLDIKSTDLADVLRTEENGFALQDTDYFVVSLGSDEDNFAVADRIRQHVGYYHLNEAPDRKTIISYIIYNSALCSSLNNRVRHDNVPRATDSAEFDVYMHAFGCMDDIYSIDNILFEGISAAAEKMGVEYLRKKEGRKEVNQKMRENWETISKNYYNYRSNISKYRHLRYKAFSAGFLKPTLFYTRSDDELRSDIQKGIGAYKAFVFSEEKTTPANTVTYPSDIDLVNQLARLEHRRWNAFMRVNGFKLPEDFEKYMFLDNDIHVAGDHKFIMLKLHPCLVECDNNGIRARLDQKGFVLEDAPLSYTPSCDELDRVSKKYIDLKHVPQIAKNDFKRWDYPECEEF